MTAAAISLLEENVLRIASIDARGRPFLAGARSQRPLANPRLEALRHYAATRIATPGTATTERLMLAGYDAVELAAIDAWIGRATSPAGQAREVRRRHDRRATAAGIGIALMSLGGFAGLNLMLITGTY